MEKTWKNPSRPIAIWLIAGVFMIIVQVILGGVTHLTDSGLSITQWQPILGAVPPTSEAAWQHAFDQYKQIGQFRELHSDFTLSDFKHIFFWEWLHRVWGRLLGVVFLLPFLYFIWKKMIRPSMIQPLIILFFLGFLQAIIGWLMVKSGLNEEDIYVSHLRLAGHFIAALILMVYTWWFAMKVLWPYSDQPPGTRGRGLLLTIIVLLILQLTWGAFMAGLKAAPAAPTWPDLNGSFFPTGWNHYQGRDWSLGSALTDNPLMVHFVHRTLAYLIFIVLIFFTVKIARVNNNTRFNRVKYLPMLIGVIQVCLGVMAVLLSPKRFPRNWGPFEWSAELHQVVALLLVLSLFCVLYLQSLGRKPVYERSLDEQRLM